MLRSFPRQLYLAITDFAFYQKVFQQPLQLSLLFLLYLGASLALLITIIYGMRFLPEVDRFVTWGEANLPAFEVSKGTLAVAADQPLITKFNGGSAITFVFDTTGTYEDPFGLEKPVLLFRREELLISIADKTEKQSWASMGSFSFKPTDLPHYGTLMKWGYFPAAYSILLVYTLLAKGLTALFLCPLAYSVALSYGVRLPWASAATIALYSLVPAITIDLLVTLLGIGIAYFDLIYLGAAGVYTFFATQKCVLAE